jgi:hypothetical protein
MTQALFKALSAAPAGVQALVSCSPGEHSVEYFTPHGPAAGQAGSAYLDALRQAASEDRIANSKAAPDAVIPAEALHKAAAKLVAGVAKQTPVLVGSAPKTAAALDPKEAPAKRFDLPGPKVATDVKAVLAELALPALVEDSDVVLRLAFPEGALRGYAPDASIDDILKNADKYPLRVATLRALQAVRDTWPLNGKEQRVVVPLPGPLTDQIKKKVAEAQQPVALAIARLEVELINLLAQEKHHAKETRRWRAHYDFTCAEVRLRLVMLNDYNRALGRVRTETLPDLPAGSPGWRLGPGEKVESGRDVRKLFEEAVEGFGRVATDHKGTPWEVLAKRALAVRPGSHWEVAGK